jgi:hypothetical protein
MRWCHFLRLESWLPYSLLEVWLNPNLKSKLNNSDVVKIQADVSGLRTTLFYSKRKKGNERISASVMSRRMLANSRGWVYRRQPPSQASEFNFFKRKKAIQNCSSVSRLVIIFLIEFVHFV